MEPQPGLMVTGNLRLSRLLGKGGMGSVWVAEHLALDTEVAVKFIDSPEALKSPSVLARFKREAGIAAKLKSPHAVQTFDHGLLPDGMPYIVMELLEGESLQQRLLRHRVLSLHETVLVVTQTAQVLSKAHKLGIVHRDLKPANLFLVDTGYELFIKLLDFGIAKHVGGLSEVGLTKTGTILGSPQYMSPEQFLDVKGVDHRGDLWSLAVVTYHCLTGMPAFLGQTLGQVILSVTNGTYQPITELRPVLPRGLDGWFAKAFAQQIEQRFQSAQELAQAFVAVVREHNAADRARQSSRQQMPVGVAPVRPPTAELPPADGSAPWPVQGGAVQGGPAHGGAPEAAASGAGADAGASVEGSSLVAGVVAAASGAGASAGGPSPSSSQGLPANTMPVSAPDAASPAGASPAAALASGVQAAAAPSELSPLSASASRPHAALPHSGASSLTASASGQHGAASPAGPSHPVASASGQHAAAASASGQHGAASPAGASPLSASASGQHAVVPHSGASHAAASASGPHGAVSHAAVSGGASVGAVPPPISSRPGVAVVGAAPGGPSAAAMAAGASGAYDVAPVTEVSAAWPLSPADPIQQTLSPAATTLDEEPKSKKLMLVAAAGALLLVGVGAGVALSGASGTADTTPEAVATGAPLSQSGANAAQAMPATGPSPTPSTAAQAALTEPSTSPSADASASPSAQASAAESAKPAAKPHARPIRRPRPHPKPKSSGYRPDMGF